MNSDLRRRCIHVVLSSQKAAASPQASTQRPWPPLGVKGCKRWKGAADPEGLESGRTAQAKAMSKANTAGHTASIGLFSWTGGGAVSGRRVLTLSEMAFMPGMSSYPTR